MSSLRLSHSPHHPARGTRRMLAAVLLVAAGMAGAAGLGLWATGGTVAPGLRLAVFPPVLTRVEAFRSIVLGNAKPIAATPIPGIWLIHVEPDEPAEVRGALVTGVGPFVRLASAACLSVTQQQP